jgi:hypothetical protein
MNDRSYKATLNISSTIGEDSPMLIEYEWDPPLTEIDSEKIPPSYAMMGMIIQNQILPVVAMNERYEAEMIDAEMEVPPEA